MSDLYNPRMADVQGVTVSKTVVGRGTRAAGSGAPGFGVRGHACTQGCDFGLKDPGSHVHTRDA